MKRNKNSIKRPKLKMTLSCFSEYKTRMKDLKISEENVPAYNYESSKIILQKRKEIKM